MNRPIWSHWKWLVHHSTAMLYRKLKMLASIMLCFSPCVVYPWRASLDLPRCLESSNWWSDGSWSSLQPLGLGSTPYPWGLARYCVRLKFGKNLYFISQIFSSLALLIFCIGYAFFFLFSFNFFQQKKHFPLMRTKPKADRIKIDNFNFFNYIFNRNLLGNNPMKSL